MKIDKICIGGLNVKMEQRRYQNYKRLAIMGGTFDPIHFGHLVTAEEVCHRFQVDKVLFIPVGTPSHKVPSSVTEKEHRFLMTELATVTNPIFEVSRMEIDRNAPTYTIDTIQELLKSCHPNVKLFFITGADAIQQIYSWKDPEKLMSLCDFIAVTRPGYKKKKLFEEINDIQEKYNGSIHFLEVPALDISSSEIRHRVKNGQSIKYLVPESVENYIYKKNLYRDIEKEVEFMLDIKVMEDKLRSALSLKRYTHTIGVMEESVKLAEHYGADIDKARVAGLLHDCAKDYPEAMKRRLCKEYHVPIDEVMDRQIDLCHPFLGAEVAKREYQVEDTEILDAIRYHTTGRKKMSQLEKIVFTADYIEPNREAFDRLEEARKLAYVDLNKAIRLILEDTIAFVKERGRKLHPLSVEALKYYNTK